MPSIVFHTKSDFFSLSENLITQSEMFSLSENMIFATERKINEKHVFYSGEILFGVNISLFGKPIKNLIFQQSEIGSKRWVDNVS